MVSAPDDVHDLEYSREVELKLWPSKIRSIPREYTVIGYFTEAYAVHIVTKRILTQQQEG